MKTFKKISDLEITDFLTLNRFTESYRGIKQSEGDYNPYLSPRAIDLKIQPDYIINDAIQDLNIISERVVNFNARKGARVGDYISLPDGQMVIISHNWNENQVQTSGGGSMHMGQSGFLSFSGGMDSGLKETDLIPTKETKKGTIWIFHGGFSGGNRGVYSKINFRVFKTRPGADLSGIPQISALKKQKLIEKSETITRINGNGNEYTMHMPEIMIVEPHDSYKDKFVKFNTFTLAGLKFKITHWNIAASQPMTRKQINDMLKMYAFKGTFYNNANNKNQLFLEATTPDDFNRILELK
jgi:hypothetical protein